MTLKQREIFDFLLKFVKSLKRENLERFLRYVTGSDNMPDVIHLDFVKQNFRAPRARLCSNLLELEDTYLSYNELSEEFLNILTNVESFRLSFV